MVQEILCGSTGHDKREAGIANMADERDASFAPLLNRTLQNLQQREYFL